MPAMPSGGLLLRVLSVPRPLYARPHGRSEILAKPVGIGEVMSGESVCEVIASIVRTTLPATSCWRRPVGARMRHGTEPRCASSTRHWRLSPRD